MKNFLALAVIVALLLGGIYAYTQLSSRQTNQTINTNEIANDAYNQGTTTSTNKPNTMQETINNGIHTATITTSKGVIEVELYGNKTPKTVENFVTLAGKGYYDGTKFHRVIKGFMIQGGDPLSKDDAKKSLWGTGGPGYQFDDELTGQETYPQGTLAMANAGPNTNGSQFFIVTASPTAPLPPSYTVFGKVTKGLEVALLIQEVKTEQPGRLDRPIDPIVIESIKVK
jgi:cyclophilin family peptidyl-prolyl cis-trans isomerase